MATPGWYPDPAGRPGAYRYWDGQDWGTEATEHPYAVPPPAPPAPSTATYQSYATHPAATYPPQAPQSYAPQSYAPQSYAPQSYAPQGLTQGWSPAPDPGPRGQGGSGRTTWLVLLAVLVTLALGVATFLVVRPLVDDDDEATARDTSTRTPPAQDPTDLPSDQDPTAQPSEPSDPPTDQPTLEPGADPFADDRTPTSRECAGGSPGQGATRTTGGKQTGGGLTMPKSAGFSDAGPLDQSAAFTFATGVSAPSKLVVDGWVAVHALGALPRANGFDSTGQAAADVLECMTLSPAFYRSFSGAEVTDSKAVEVDGHPAWVVDAEIRIDDPELDVEGDVAQVVVVDTGDLDNYGVLVSVVAIGQAKLLAQQQKLVDTLTVD